MYYWYYGSLAMFQVGGKPWKTWNIALQEALLHIQETSGGAAGSFPPIDPWGGAAGRVYATAICALTLETPFRFARYDK